MGIQSDVGVLAGCFANSVRLQINENLRLENNKISMNLVKNSKPEVEI